MTSIAINRPWKRSNSAILVVISGVRICQSGVRICQSGVRICQSGVRIQTSISIGQG
jgi:hypothetical protein